MNKILMDRVDEFDLSKTFYEFDKDNKYFVEVADLKNEICLVVLENVNITLNILGNRVNLDLRIKVGKNSSLVINSFIIDGSINVYSVLEDFNASFKLYNSILATNDSLNKIEVKHLSKNTNSYLKNHGFSLDGSKIIFDVDSYVPNDSSSCVAKQDNKIIGEDNSLSQINPNLYIDNYDIEASHSAYVGEFKEEEIFYLMSRGLTLEDSKFLLLKSFLVGSMEVEDEVLEKYCGSVVKFFNKEV